MKKPIVEKAPRVTDPEGGLRFPARLACLALLVGLGFEFLLDRRPLGLSFLLWMSLCLATLLLASRTEGARPARSSLLLMVPILFFSAIVAIRAEPMTTIVSLAVAVGLTAWLVRAYTTGDLRGYGGLDLALVPLTVPIEASVRPWGTLSEASRSAFGEKAARSRAAGLVRGLLLALPVVIVFAAFLAGADLIFADYLKDALRWLNLENLADWIARGMVVLVVGVGSLGVFVAALRPAAVVRRLGLDRLTIPPFLGSTEALTVLGAVDVLFASFVAIQFRYLFGGQSNIVSAGYTYSEYARRGFGELVAVAFLSLGMIVFLSTWSHRKNPSVFLGLSAALVGLVGVMLASALTRLLLYEQAYGFTRLRTYTHAGILWLGILFGFFLILLWWGRLQLFGLAVVVAGVGWTASLGLLGVDAFIVRENGIRLAASRELDTAYLGQLSNDAVPGLVRLARAAPPSERQELLAGLACRRAVLTAEGPRAWAFYHVARARAAAELGELQSELADFRLKKPTPDPWTWSVVSEGVEWSCTGPDW